MAGKMAVGKRRLRLTPSLFAVITGMLAVGAVLFYPSAPVDAGAYEDSALPFSVKIFVWGAQILNQWLSKDKTVLDMRYYELLLSLYFLLALYLFVKFAAGQLQRGKYLAALLGVFIFCDGAYLNWFRSFSPEGVVYPSLILMIACILLLSQKSSNMFFLFFLSAGGGMMMVCAMPEKGFLWCTAGAAFLYLTVYFVRKKDGKPLHPVGGGRAFRILSGVGAAAFFTGAVLSQIYGVENNIIDKYHSMTRGIMSSSDNPEEALEFFGIDSSFSILDGTSAYERYPVIKADDELLYRDFYSHYDTGSIILYYLTHPGSFMYMMESAASQGYVIDSGTAAADKGQDGQSQGKAAEVFWVYSRAKASYIPKTLGFLLIFMVIFCTAGRKERFSTGLVGLLIFMGVLLMALTVIDTGAVEAGRTLFYYNVVFDMGMLLISARMLSWIWGRVRTAWFHGKGG